MSALDSGIADIAMSSEAPVITTDSAVETPSTETTTNNDTDLQVITADEAEGAEDSGEGKETELKNADGSDKTPEQQEKFKTDAAAKAAGGKEVLPQEARAGLKALKELDNGKYAKVVAQLHGHFERYEAIKPLLGTGGVNQLKSVLEVAGVKNVGELQQTLGQTQTMIDTVKGTDELLYKADPILSQNVYDDMKASGTEKNYGKVVSNFVEHLKTADPDAFYAEVAKPLTLAGMDEAGIPAALNSLHKALLSGDTATAKAITKSIADFYVNLRDEFSEKSKISKERQAWEAERTSKETEVQKQERVKTEQSIATDCEKSSNTILGKSLGGFLRLPFFKDFPYETKVDLGNGIKDRLYAALKADKQYQTAMSTLWKGKTLDQAKMLQVHKAWLETNGDRIVRETVQARYPGYAKGGSSAGKAAAAVAKKDAGTKAAAQSINSMRPIYVAARPSNLIREDITLGGKVYTSSDLQTLQITGKGFVRTTDGKGVKFVSWRKN